MSRDARAAPAPGPGNGRLQPWHPETLGPWEGSGGSSRPGPPDLPCPPPGLSLAGVLPGAQLQRVWKVSWLLVFAFCFVLLPNNQAPPSSRAARDKLCVINTPATALEGQMCELLQGHLNSKQRAHLNATPCLHQRLQPWLCHRPLWVHTFVLPKFSPVPMPLFYCTIPPTRPTARSQTAPSFHSVVVVTSPWHPASPSPCWKFGRLLVLPDGFLPRVGAREHPAGASLLGSTRYMTFPIFLYFFQEGPVSFQQGLSLPMSTSSCSL